MENKRKRVRVKKTSDKKREAKKLRERSKLSIGEHKRGKTMFYCKEK